MVGVMEGGDSAEKEGERERRSGRKKSELRTEVNREEKR